MVIQVYVNIIIRLYTKYNHPHVRILKCTKKILFVDTYTSEVCTYIHVHCNLFSFEFYIKTTNQINKTNQNLGSKRLNISKYMYSNIVKSHF